MCHTGPNGDDGWWQDGDDTAVVDSVGVENDRPAWLGAAALLLVSCGGGSTAPSTPDRVTQNFDYTLRLTPTSWMISGSNSSTLAAPFPTARARVAFPRRARDPS
jgi:hypothetical protein